MQWTETQSAYALFGSRCGSRPSFYLQSVDDKTVDEDASGDSLQPTQPGLVVAANGSLEVT